MASSFRSVAAPLVLLLAALFVLSPVYVAGEAVNVTFTIQKLVSFGRGLVITGNYSSLGNWTPASGAFMSVNLTTEQDWTVTVTVDLDVGERVEYKPVITDFGTGNNPTWFPYENLVFELPDATALVVPIIWTGSSLSRIKEV